MSKQPERITANESPKLPACRICLDLAIDRVAHNPYSGHLVHLSDLQQSVDETNCPGCGVLCEAIDRTHKRYGFQFSAVKFWYTEGLSIEFRSFHYAKANGPLKRNDFDMSGRHKGLDMWRMDKTWGDESIWSADAVVAIQTPRFEIFRPETKARVNARATFSPHPHAWSAVLARPSRSESTGSEEAIEWARSKLDDCRKKHVGACRPVIKAATSLPTRVLDLGNLIVSTDPAFATSEAPEVRLYISHGVEADYVCLSHCWGSSTDDHKHPLETTRKTYGLFQNIIEWSLLPKTFQDAVTFTKGLGIQYLWIDSLCIIQDSTEDWSLEAGKMAAIYSNAALVLAAAASSNSHEGLFREANTTTELMSKPKIKGSGLQHKTSMLLMREFTSHPNTVSTENYLPLFQRAWVLQERLLAQRTLFFTPLELVWECLSAEEHESESGHLWIDQSLKQAIKQVSHADSIAPFGGSLELPMKHWQDLVEDYSRLKLSHPADILPALAGMAKVFARFFQCEYLAGLWRKTLFSDLLWRCSPTGRYGLPPHVPMVEGIPTWSWACLGGQPVTWAWIAKWHGDPRDIHAFHFADVVAASCDSRIGDQFVQVDNGRVVISGYPIPFVVGTRCRVSVRSSLSKQVLFPCNLPGCDELEAEPDYNWLEPPNGRPKIGRGDIIYVMPIMDNSALVLVPKPPIVGVAQPEGGQFVRIGCAQPKVPGFVYSERYRYLYEGDSLIVNELERHVEYGQVRLDAGEDGGENFDEDMDRHAMFLFEQSERKIILTYTSSRSQLHYSAQLIEELKRQLDAERHRVREWKERHDRGEEQVHTRVAVVIV